jgi:hypothetical protein
MSPLGLFVMGVLVTLFYGAGLSLLVYGAMLDGRDEERRKAEEAERAAQARVVGRPHPVPVPDHTTTEAGDFPAAA